MSHGQSDIVRFNKANMLSTDITEIKSHLESGNIIIYPTETVYGIGCNPYNDKALKIILDLKQRSLYKGLILVANKYETFFDFIDRDKINKNEETKMLKSWPGPFSWIVPAKKNISPLITGCKETVAIRVSPHPFIQNICKLIKKPLISTSANLSGYPACETIEEVQSQFKQKNIIIVNENNLKMANASTIIDLKTGKIIR